MDVERLSDVLREAGKWTGLIGFALVAIVLVLTSRAPWLERRWGGLPKLYRAHHHLGIIAFLLMLVHPGFLALSVYLISSEAATLFISLDNLLILSGWASLTLFGLLIFTSLNSRLRYELWRLIHIISGLAFALALWHADLARSVGTFNRIWILLFGLVGGVAFIYREVFVRFGKARHRYRLEGIRELGASILELYLSPTGFPLIHEPGQFIYLVFHYFGRRSPSSRLLRESHPFSIASAPEEGMLRIVVKMVGDYTRALRTLHSGNLATVEGPYGQLLSDFTSPHPKRQFWLAGGIGIAPFLGVLRARATVKVQVDIHFFARSVEADIFSLELRENSSGNPGYRVFTHYETDEGLPSLSAMERFSGAVDSSAQFVLCGPPAMVRYFQRELTNRGIPSTHITAEEFHFR